jgi:hypothetical protein
MIKVPKSAGKSFNVTDAGSPITVEDMYRLLRLKTGFKNIPLWKTAFLPLAYLVEWWTIACFYIPALPQPGQDLIRIQPALWNTIMPVQFASNERASLSPEKGGIGYKPLCTSLEGMSQEVIDFLQEKKKAELSGKSASENLDKKLENIAQSHAPIVRG